MRSECGEEGIMWEGVRVGLSRWVHDRIRGREGWGRGGGEEERKIKLRHSSPCER